MIRFQVGFKTVMVDFPEIVEEFMNNLRNSNSKFKNIDLDNIEWYYSCDFEYGDIDVDVELSRFELKYQDRLKFELSKLNINVTMKAGQFKSRDSVNSVIIPKNIISIVNEIVKIMMVEEQKFFADDEVTKSIPPIDDIIYDEFNLLGYVGMYEGLGAYMMDDDMYLHIDDVYDGVEYANNESEEIYYELDEILDKIYTHGIVSLTEGEKEFLDNKSRDL